jgi:hypothetical protein
VAAQRLHAGRRRAGDDVEPGPAQRDHDSLSSLRLGVERSIFVGKIAARYPSPTFTARTNGLSSLSVHGSLETSRYPGGSPGGWGLRLHSMRLRVLSLLMLRMCADGW